MTALLCIWGGGSAILASACVLALILSDADIDAQRILALIFFWPLIALGLAVKGVVGILRA